MLIHIFFSKYLVINCSLLVFIKSNIFIDNAQANQANAQLLVNQEVIYQAKHHIAVLTIKLLILNFHLLTQLYNSVIAHPHHQATIQLQILISMFLIFSINHISCILFLLKNKI